MQRNKIFNVLQEDLLIDNHEFDRHVIIEIRELQSFLDRCRGEGGNYIAVPEYDDIGSCYLKSLNIQDEKDEAFAKRIQQKADNEQLIKARSEEMEYKLYLNLKKKYDR